MSKYDCIAKNVLVKTMYNKTIIKNENFILVMIGGTGSGKSYSMISLAQKFQKYLYFKRKEVQTDKTKPLLNPPRIWIIFTYKELLDLLLDDVQPTIHKGDTVIYEEMGVSADHRKFWSLTNDTIRYVSQLARNRNFNFFMNLPFLKLLDKDVLPLVHFTLETFKKHATDKIVKCKIKKNSVNYIEGKSYFKFPYLYIRELNARRRVKFINFTHPEEEIKFSNVTGLKDYEEKKDVFNNSIYMKLRNMGNKLNEEKKQNSVKDVKEIMKEVIKRKEEFIKHRNNCMIINESKIKLSFNVGSKMSKMIKSGVEEKLGIGWGVPIK